MSEDHHNFNVAICIVIVIIGLFLTAAMKGYFDDKPGQAANGPAIATVLRENPYQLTQLFGIDDCSVYSFTDPERMNNRQYIAICPHGPHIIGEAFYYHPSREHKERNWKPTITHKE